MKKGGSDGTKVGSSGMKWKYEVINEEVIEEVINEVINEEGIKWWYEEWLCFRPRFQLSDTSDKPLVALYKPATLCTAIEPNFVVQKVAVHKVAAENSGAKSRGA